MIFTDRTITVRKGESRIDEPIVVYRGDYELEVRFTILNSRFKFMSGTNMIESEKASYGQLAILTPYGGNIFSDIVRCNDGSVTFVLTAEMLNQIEEVGLYSFQIRLMDYNKESRVSIPPIEYGIEVREPIASEDHDNSVNNAIVGYSIAKVVDPKEENVGDTFDENGNYNKTKWETGDRISEGKLNKIEDAIDKVNKNEMNNSVSLSKRIDNNFNVLDATKADITDVTVLTNRIDNMSRLNDGSTTGDAELMDGRVDLFGLTHANIGDAIRSQSQNVIKELNIIETESFNVVKNVSWEQGGISFDQATEVANSKRIRTKMIRAEKGSKITLANKQYVFGILHYDKELNYIVPSSVYTHDNFINGVYIIENENVGAIRIVMSDKAVLTDSDNVNIGVDVANYLDLHLIAPKDKDVDYKMEKSNHEFRIRGINFKTGVPDDSSKNRLATYGRWYRGKKGSVIRLTDKANYLFMVFEYQYNNNDGLLTPRTINDWRTEDYVIENELCEYYRVSLKRVDDAIFTDTTEASVIETYPIVGDVIDFSYESPQGKPYYVSTNPFLDVKSDAPLYNTLISKYDELMGENPSYITKTELGLDQSGTYPIYKYVFDFNNVGISGKTVGKSFGPKTKHTIILDAGIHGNEYPCTIALLNMMAAICNDWQTNETLQYLRWNFKFVIIPVTNPWGYANNKRNNVNHVDLNRNFEAGGYWSKGDNDPTSDRYRGSAPYSEKEAQYIKSVLESEKEDAILYFNIHTFGMFSSYAQMTATNMMPMFNTEKLSQASFDLIKNITFSGWKNHNLPKNSGWIGVCEMNELGGQAMGEGAANGIPSMVVEGMYQYYGQPDTRWTTDLNNMRCEYLVNAVMYSLKRLLK